MPASASRPFTKCSRGRVPLLMDCAPLAGERSGKLVVRTLLVPEIRSSPGSLLLRSRFLPTTVPRTGACSAAVRSEAFHSEASLPQLTASLGIDSSASVRRAAIFAISASTAARISPHCDLFLPCADFRRPPRNRRHALPAQDCTAHRRLLGRRSVTLRIWSARLTPFLPLGAALACHLGGGFLHGRPPPRPPPPCASASQARRSPAISTVPF